MTSSTASGSITCPLVASPPNGAWLAVQVIAHNLARWTASDRAGRGDRHDQDAPGGGSSLSPGGSLALLVSSRSICRRAGPGPSTSPPPSPGCGRSRSRPDAARPRRPLTAWRQHACERLPTAVSSCPHARTATVAPSSATNRSRKRPFRALQPAQPRPSVDSGLGLRVKMIIGMSASFRVRV